MRQAPLRHDRAAARDDAGDAVGGEVDVGQPHAGMDGEVVDALFALFDQRVACKAPRSVFNRIAVAFLQRLIYGNGADRDRRVAQESIRGWCGCCARWRDPSRCRRPSGSTTPSCRLLPRHDEVTAELPILALILVEEVAADDHRLEFAMVDVAGNDGAAARDFTAHEFRRDERRNRRAKAFAVGQRRFRALEFLHFTAEVLARRQRRSSPW